MKILSSLLLVFLTTVGSHASSAQQESKTVTHSVSGGCINIHRINNPQSTTTNS